MSFVRRSIFAGLVTLAVVASASPAAAILCTQDQVPAASLLIPYFEVDVSDSACANADGRTTVISIHNEDPMPTWTWVTLWTDWGEPGLYFGVYLTGYDTQTLNLRDIFCGGELPETGPETSPHGDFSEDPLTETYPIPEVPTDHLKAWFTGQQSPLTGTCAGYAGERPQELAIGYVTINGFDPGDVDSPIVRPELWPEGNLSDRNVLWGEWLLVDPAEESAQGFTAVAIEAASSANEISVADRTFYALSWEGIGYDEREPLATAYVARYAIAGPFDDTEILVWREVPPSQGEVECGSFPPWWGLDLAGILAFNEREDSVVLAPLQGPNLIPIDPGPLANATGVWSMTENPAFVIPQGFEFGRLYLTLQSNVPLEAYQNRFAQAWVGVRFRADGLYSAGVPALPLDSACSITAFTARPVPPRPYVP